MPRAHRHEPPRPRGHAGPNCDVLAEAVAGPVERLWLERSYHVATLDYDKAEIESAVVDFARRVTS